MGKRNYAHVQALLPEIKAMLAEGKNQRETAEYYSFTDISYIHTKQGVL